MIASTSMFEICRNVPVRLGLPWLNRKTIVCQVRKLNSIRIILNSTTKKRREDFNFQSTQSNQIVATYLKINKNNFLSIKDNLFYFNTPRLNEQCYGMLCHARPEKQHITNWNYFSTLSIIAFPVIKNWKWRFARWVGSLRALLLVISLFHTIELVWEGISYMDCEGTPN